jgi:hypothetical protein
MLTRTHAEHTLTSATAESKHWEAPAGFDYVTAAARLERPVFVYVGLGDPHWTGQSCYLEAVSDSSERVVIMSCGCRASVPWWTLDPA